MYEIYFILESFLFIEFCRSYGGIAFLFSTAVPSLSLAENGHKYKRVAHETDQDVVDQKRLGDAGSNDKKEM